MPAFRPSAIAGWLAFFWIVPLSRADDATTTTFERQVRPILKAYCLDCHGGGSELKGKLDLRLARTARRGGKLGPALVPGKPDESVLLDRIREGEMPPGEKKVPPAQVALIERRIAQGARTLRDEPESLPPGIDITPEECVLGVSADPTPPAAGRRPRGSGSRPHADRRLPARAVAVPRIVIRTGGRPRGAPAPRRVRPHRATSFSRSGR